MFKPRYATFHQAVVACFHDGFQGLAAYTAAQTLLLDQYAHLIAHQAAATPQAEPEQTPEAPQAWYHLTFVSVGTQKASTPTHGVLAHQGQPLGHFRFQAQSVNTHLVQAPAGLPCGSVHHQTLDGAQVVYQLEAIDPEHLLAYQRFHQAPHAWQAYRQQLAQHQPQDPHPNQPRYPTQPAAELFGPRSVHQGLGQNAHIEGVKRIADYLVIHGWVNNPLRTLRAIVLTDINNQTALNLAPHMARFESPDVAQTFGLPIKNKQQVYRFITAIHMRQVPSALYTNLLNLHFIHEHTVYSQALPTTEPLTTNLDGIYQLLGLLGPYTVTQDTCHNVLAPIFTAVARALQTQALQPTCQWFNPSQAPAQLSVIIPLYGSVRFEVTQIAALAALQFPGLEVIFAVDDPTIHADVLANVQRQSACFGLCCAVVFPGVNLGFSGINNFAVQYASAPAVLFLNSDCFITQAQPLQQGLSWLHAPRPKQQPAGALGFRLLYPGGKLQHDGMSNDCWATDPQFIVNLHPRIGQDPTQYPPGHADGQASLLTAACLLMHKHVFNTVGGFNRTYLRGDFEDSDLCLTLINAGYALGLLQTHHIYHLERQTIAQHTPAARQTITLVNSHLYKQRWHSLIQEGLPRLEMLA